MPALFDLILALLGVLLALIVIALVFSSAFRRDVLASEGETTVFGVLSVQGAVVGVFFGVFLGAIIVLALHDPRILRHVETRLDEDASFRDALIAAIMRRAEDDPSLFEVDTGLVTPRLQADPAFRTAIVSHLQKNYDAELLDVDARYIIERLDEDELIRRNVVDHLQANHDSLTFFSDHLLAALDGRCGLGDDVEVTDIDRYRETISRCESIGVVNLLRGRAFGGDAPFLIRDPRVRLVVPSNEIPPDTLVACKGRPSLDGHEIELKVGDRTRSFRVVETMGGDCDGRLHMHIRRADLSEFSSRLADEGKATGYIVGRRHPAG